MVSYQLPIDEVFIITRHSKLDYSSCLVVAFSNKDDADNFCIEKNTLDDEWKYTYQGLLFQKSLNDIVD